MTRAATNPVLDEGDAADVVAAFRGLPGPWQTGVDQVLAARSDHPYRHRYDATRPAAARPVSAWHRSRGYRFVDGLVHDAGGDAHPLLLASLAERCYANLYAAGDSAEAALAARHFIVVAHALHESATPRGDGTTWVYLSDFADLRAPWTSALAQACVIDILIKHAGLSGMTFSRALAERAAALLPLPVEEGGFAATDPRGRPWLEEYAGSRRHRHVLNGFLTTIVILDKRRADLEAVLPGRVVDEWIDTAIGAIPEYTRRDLIWYSWRRGRTPLNYYRQMVGHLEILNRRRADPVFVEFAERWRRMETHPPPPWWRRWSRAGGRRYRVDP